MDCSYKNQRRSCRCPQMNPPVMPSKDCCCGEPPTMIPDCPVIEPRVESRMEPRMQPRMPMRPIPPCNCMEGGAVMPNYTPVMPIRNGYDCPDTGVRGMEMYSIAMGYIPWQQWRQTYTLDKGLCRGTIFPELDLPFVMGRCR